MFYRRSINPDSKTLKKRKRSTIPWKKDIDKYRRYQPKGPPLPPACSHSCSKFECSTLGQEEMENFHKRFYYTRDKVSQDAFILRHCQGMSPKRRSTTALKKRRVTTVYYIPTKERTLQVCKETFVGILRVKKYRIDAIVRSFYRSENSRMNIQKRMSSCRRGIESCEMRRQNMYKLYHAHNSHKIKTEKSANGDANRHNSCFVGHPEEGTNTGFAVLLAAKKDTFSNDMSGQVHRSSPSLNKRQKRTRVSNSDGTIKTAQQPICSRNRLEPEPVLPSAASDDNEIHMPESKNLRRSIGLAPIKTKRHKTDVSSVMKKPGKICEDRPNAGYYLEGNNSIQTPAESNNVTYFLTISDKLLQSELQQNGIHPGEIRISAGRTSSSCANPIHKKEEEGTEAVNGTILDNVSRPGGIKEKKLRFCTPVSQKKWKERRTRTNENEERKQNTINTATDDRQIICSAITPEKDGKVEGAIPGMIGRPNVKLILPENIENDCDWLKTNAKERSRTFNWSPLGPPFHEEKDGAPSASIECRNSKDAYEFSEPRYHLDVTMETTSQSKSRCEQETKCSDKSTGFEVATGGTKPTNPDSQTEFHEHPHGLVYESKKRRLRKLQRTIEDKENFTQEMSTNKQNEDISMLKQKPKSIVPKNYLVKSSFLKRTANKFNQKTRFPLQTIQYFKNQSFIYGKT